MVVVAVVLEVSVMPYINVADGIPDLIAPTVVVVALLRGPLVGAVTGFGAGLLIELTSPVGTLGVMALLYLAVGAWCGRYCESEESSSLLAPLLLSVVATLAVQLGYAVFQLLLGNSMPASEFVAQLLLPTVALTALLSPPVLLVGRRLLGAPRVVEPWARMSGVTTTFRPRRPPGRLGGGGGGGWAPALTPRIAVRIAILGGIAMALLGILLVRLWFLQVIAGEQYAERAEGNRLRTVVSEAPRGNIVDRNGTALVKNTIGENLVAQPRELQGARRVAILNRLSKVIGVPASELVKDVEGGDDQPLEPVILAQNVDPGISQYLAERQRDFPGISLQKTYLRSYPEGSIAAHILGQTGRIGPDRDRRLPPQGLPGRRGGREGRHRAAVRGVPDGHAGPGGGGGGRRRRAAGPRVHQLARAGAGPQHPALHRHARPRRRSRAAWPTPPPSPARRGRPGIAMDPRTGEVLALASYPTFNPEIFVKRRTKEIERINKDPDFPLLDRAIQGVYPAGSTFKPITAAAAIQGGELGVDEELGVAGGHHAPQAGVPQLRAALARHDHPADGARGVQRHVLLPGGRPALGRRRTRRSACTRCRRRRAQFGLGRDTGIDLPSENPANVPDPPWKRKAYAGSQYTDFQRSLAGRRHDPARRRPGVPAGDARSRWRSPTPRSRTAGRS